ncbi:MAG: Fe-S-cluster-containing hydrogenase [Bdellovibrionales bacterium]|nr:Fe-S-cluster-containing hydrogenase [Bdellovibrionales bacterium]
MSDNKMDNQKFEKPRHWVTLDELTPEYWADSKIQERRGQEFYDKPIETIAAIDNMDKAGVSRRDFLTVMGASMAMASFACARRPLNKIIPYVVQPQELTPGVPLYYASTLKIRGHSHGIVVRTREGRPIKLEGNDLHPINQGALGVEGQAAILGLYDPDRLKAPMKGAKGGSKTTESWKDVDSIVTGAFKDARKVRIVSYPCTSDSTRRIMKEFMTGFADAKWLEVDPLGRDDVADGQGESYGGRIVPTYHFEHAEVVVSFGADFLGSWGNEVENSRDWAKGRKLFKKEDKLSKLFVYESNFSVTGANADERLAIIPGNELAAALAVAYELMINQKKGRFAESAEVKAIFTGQTLDSLLGKAGGLDHAKVKATAEALWEARGKSLIVGSGDTALQVVINLLNSNLDNEGKTVDGNGDVSMGVSNIRQLAQLQTELESGSVDVVIFHKVNPVYFLPNGEAFANATKKCKAVISINTHLDETNDMADVVLAESHDLECWGDGRPRPSIYSLQQPTISPIADTRSFEDILINWVRGGVKGSGLLATTAANAKGNYYDYVKENWKQNVFMAFGKGRTFLDFWETALQKGVVLGKVAPAHERAFKMSALKSVQKAAGELKSLTIAKAKKGPAIEGSGIMLGTYASSMADGQGANNAWLQELPDPMSTVTWDNYLNVGPAFAAELGLQSNDVVTVKTEGNSIEIPVLVQPGIAKGAVTVAVGYGRRIAGKVGSHVGQNAFKFVRFDGENGMVFGGMPVTIAKTGKKYELAVTQGHNKTEGRPIINDITYEQYKNNESAANHTDPHLRLKEVPTLWGSSPVDYAKQPYKWIMGIDLNACTGCGACVIACQSENNIPVVGRDRVRQSREMHWMRIDRYYTGNEENPNVVFQPMLCQHCDNAPCETVCPVIATSHSEDGLNQMTYSRCVGTRYCQNNCPYKTRRFNFFDHWKDYKDTMNLVWNPDVTVRSRGIMEKCTFCVQRINEAKGKAKDRNVKIKDQDLKTACQQTCPTEAIVFGNENDGDAQVLGWKNHPRAFRALEILNTRPAIHYLTKVRNIEGGGEHHG